VSLAAAKPSVVVVGGGLAGLTAALRLAEAGYVVTVLEAEGRVGGRARTLEVGGEPVDRGFQSVFTAYPRTRALIRDIGMTPRDLVAFDRGAVVHDGAQWARMSPSPAGVARFPWFRPGDVVRLARLGAEVAGAPDAALLSGHEREEDIAGYLGRLGFSETSVEGFFRPLFGVITADPALSSDAGYFRWLLKMLLRGRAVVPVEGHGMIAAWAAARVRQLGGTVRTGCRVDGIRTDPDDRGTVTGVQVSGGEWLEADAVVVAAGANAARALVRDLDRQAARDLDLVPRGVTTLVYELAGSFHSGRTIVLNGAPRDGAPRIDLVCQESNLLRPGPGRGVRLLATAVHGEGGRPDPGALEAAMAERAESWNPGFGWRAHARLAEVVEHPAAQFAVPPGVRDDLPDVATGIENLLLAGDFTMHPSIEGAVSSGERAAAVVARRLSDAVARGH